MTFQEIIKLLYVNSAYFKTQPDFLNNLLIGSVDDSNKISLSQSTLKGFFQGNKITNLAPQLIEAGFSVDNFSAYIESLYKKQHKDTPTCNKKFNGKTYKEVLYEEAKKKFDDITPDNMSTVLAKQFYKIINDACNNVNCKENTTTLSYSITESEKNEIKNICRLIDEELSKLQRTTNEIILKQSEIEKLTDSEPDQKWKKSLECDVNWQKKPFNKSCQKLEKYCGDYVSLYGAKKHLHWSLEKIYDIANEISSKIYKITCPDDFKSENLSLAVSNFNKYYNFLLRVIEKHII